MAPAPDESATVTVQVDGWLSGTLAGEQETVVVVFLFVEARLNVPLLPECAASGVYVPVIRAWPTTVGVSVTLHDPLDRVQVVALKVPVLLVVKLTVPVGVTV